MDEFSTGAYALPSGVVIIQAFRKEAGEYVLADQVGDSLFGLLYYRKFDVLGSPQTNQLWLLVQGQVAGYMGDLERARIYSFDGYKFREEWKPEDRVSMHITTYGNQINARYLSEKIDLPVGQTQNCIEEKLQLGAGGLLSLGSVTHNDCADPESLPK